MRLTLADLKFSSLPGLLGVASCDPRFLEIVNEAQQRLVMSPDTWWETYQKYRLQTCSGMVTWPRQVANIISLTVDCQPYTIRNEWFEFLESGYGQRNSQSLCGPQVIDRGTSSLFEDINTDGNDKGLKLYSSLPEAVGLQMGIMGWDAGGDWVRTSVLGTFVDGEWLDVPLSPLAPITSGRNWSAITDIVKPITSGELILYEYDALIAVQRRIGIYESDETRPKYRRTLIGGIGNGIDSETAHTITAMVKREFIPARNDNDFLLIGNFPAIKEMAIGIVKSNGSNMQEAFVRMREASRLMDAEASHYIGQSRVVPIRMEAEAWGMGDVPYVQ